MKLSNLLYTSAFTLALGVAAPMAVADTTGAHANDSAHGQHQDGKRGDKDMGGHHDGTSGNPGAPGTTGTGTTGAGSSTPDAPTHTPGGTNPDGAPDANRSVE